jgi:tetratricopeptide (TPR) repeat protein
MPNRPRSHQLEDESITFLKSIIPDSWVYRDLKPDYGLDGNIEIFDDSGNSTGLMFFVQIKGTDEHNKNNALSFRLNLDYLSYYKSLQIPVLLVRYLSATKEIYIRWAYGIDPYYTRKGSKTIKINFSEDCRWLKETSDKVITELKVFKKFKNPDITIPIKFQFNFPEEEICSIPISIIESIIRKEAEFLSDIIIFSSNIKDSTIPTITITNEIIKVDIVGLTGFVLHHHRSYSKKEIENELSYDILVSISIAIGRLGHNNIAVQIAEKSILKSSLLKNYKILFCVLDSFIKAKRIDLAFSISEQALDKTKDYYIHFLFAIPVFFKVNMTQEELESYKTLLLKAKNNAIECGHTESAGSCHYNIGNRLGYESNSNKDRIEAFHHYRMASKYDPKYKERNYYWGEMAGILFLLRKYKFSTKYYKKALDLGAEPQVLALYADSLMFAGYYEEAYNKFKEYFAKVKKSEEEWCLKSYVLGRIVKDFNIKEQRRYPIEAIILADMSNMELSDAEFHLKKALEKDFLCGNAWFNRGILFIKKQEFDEAFFPFLMAGLVQPNDVESWMNTLVCIFNSKSNMNLLPLILTVAYLKNGEDFILELANKVSFQTDNTLSKSIKNQLISMISSFLHKINKNKNNFPILRIINTNGNYQVYGNNKKIE